MSPHLVVVVVFGSVAKVDVSDTDFWPYAQIQEKNLSREKGLKFIFTSFSPTRLNTLTLGHLHLNFGPSNGLIIQPLFNFFSFTKAGEKGEKRRVLCASAV